MTGYPKYIQKFLNNTENCYDSQKLDDLNNARSNGSRVMSRTIASSKQTRRSHRNTNCNLIIFGRWETIDDYGSDRVKSWMFPNTLISMKQIIQECKFIFQIGKKWFLEFRFRHLVQLPVHKLKPGTLNPLNAEKYEVYLSKDLDYEERFELRMLLK